MKRLFLLPLLALSFGAPAHAQLPLPQAAPPEETKLPVPDVRGLEYRTATLPNPIPRANLARDEVATGHFWILPEKNGAKPQGIGWDGVVYDLNSVGEAASWREDAKRGLQPRKPNDSYVRTFLWEFAPRNVPRFYLEQLGAPELAEQIRVEYSGGFGGFGSGVTPPPLDHIRTAWVRNLRDAGALAFACRRFGEAKRAFETVLANTPAGDGFHDNASFVLAEIARRQHDTPRPTEEVAGLIWDLQNARVTREGNLGGIAWSSSPELEKLVVVGDRAVEPLIDALEKDKRLTLALSGTRSSFLRIGGTGSVRDAALWLINTILHREYYADYQVGDDQGLPAMIAEIRADWAKLKGQSPAQRIRSTLAQSRQKPERLEEAAMQLEQVKEPARFIPAPIAVPGALEELLAHRNPSVSDLLVERINELSARAEKRDATEQELMGNAYTLDEYVFTANKLMMTLWQWDAERALPLMGPQLERTEKFLGRERSVYTRLDFLRARRDTPYRAQAMEEYGQWVSSVPLGSLPEQSYEPLWRYLDEPALQKAAQTLFAAPKTPFQTAAQKPDGSFYADVAFHSLSKPLVQLPVVREAIERELQNQTIVASMERQTDAGGQMSGRIKVLAWKESSSGQIPLNHPLENGDSQPLRVADLVGYFLYKKAPPGANYAFDPLLDVSLPQKERDAQIQKIIELVRKGEVATR